MQAFSGHDEAFPIFPYRFEIAQNDLLTIH